MSAGAVVPGLLHGGWRDLDFAPFRPGIEICSLTSGDGPHWAILRYAPGATVPLHRHTGLESILVLDGSQSDEAGTYTAGTLILNPPGSRHAVASPDGCVVLIQWERPVEILDREA